MFLRQITRFLYHFVSIFQNFSKLFNNFTFFCRRQALTTAEILNELELMTASDLPGTSADVFICPPDGAGYLSDADSGDEDFCSNPDKLNGNQLKAQAELVVRDTGAEDDDLDSDCSITEDELEPDVPAKKKKTNKSSKKKEKPCKASRTWVKGDLQLPSVQGEQSLLRSAAASSVNSNSGPLDFWQLFM